MTENYYALTRLADAGRAAELRRAELDRLARAVVRATAQPYGGLRARAGAALVRLALLLDGAALTGTSDGAARPIRSASV